MLKIKTITSLIIIASLNSCQFKQSVNKDLKTGAYSRGDGISVDNIALVINGEVENRNEFVFGEAVNIVFNNITGLSKSNGKVFPEMSMYVIKSGSDTVLSDPNLFSSMSNGTDHSPLQLQANFRTALPNHNNEKYKVFIEITDKKGEGTFKYELPFSVKEYDLLNIESTGIEYSTVYLWNETLKQPVFDNTISSEHFYVLILNGIEGLDSTYPNVFPVFSLDLIDKNGQKLLSNPNVLSEFEEIGVSPKVLKRQVNANLSFTKEAQNTRCKLTAKLNDKFSSKELNITTELYIK